MLVVTIKRARSQGGRARSDDTAYPLPVLYRDLASRLAAALQDTWEEDASTKDEETGHEFHGNQYVDIPGSAKPTSAKAKTAKGKLHELLSSGHAFSKQELMQIAGFEQEVTLSTWLSKFKSQKHAADYGALDIKKLPNGTYQVVMPNGALAGPAKAADPVKVPEIKAPEVEKKIGYQAGKINVPDVPLEKTKADSKYAGDMDDLLNMTAANFVPFASVYIAPETAVMEFKHGKTLAMAQWKTNVTGVEQKPKYDPKLYEADKILAKAFAGSGGNTKIMATAIQSWKSNTALEKQGMLAPGGGVKDPIPVGATKAPAAAMSKAWHSDAPSPTAVPYENMVPAGFEPISSEDLTSGKGGFGTGIASFKKFLLEQGGNAIANKKTVEMKLKEHLADKPHFQGLVKAVAAGNKYASGGSVEARLVASWAASSGDGNPLSSSLQVAVREAFSIPQDHLEMKQLFALKDGEHTALELAADRLGVKLKTNQEVHSFKSALREFVQAQHAVTQTMLKDAGIDHVYLARGMKIAAKDPKVKVKLQPASSFSADYATAKQFASDGGTVYLVKVPASQVLSTYHSGFGCSSEHEVVVMAHDNIESYAVPSSDASTVAVALQHIRKRVGEVA